MCTHVHTVHLASMGCLYFRKKIEEALQCSTHTQFLCNCIIINSFSTRVCDRPTLHSALIYSTSVCADISRTRLSARCSSVGPQVFPLLCAIHGRSTPGAPDWDAAEVRLAVLREALRRTVPWLLLPLAGEPDALAAATALPPDRWGELWQVGGHALCVLMCGCTRVPVCLCVSGF